MPVIPDYEPQHEQREAANSAVTKRKAREIRNAKIKPQRIVQFYEDSFNKHTDKEEEQPARQSVIIAPKRFAEKYTEVNNNRFLIMNRVS